MNTFGRNFRLTTFGESHGAAVGGVIDGMPPRVKVDMDRVQAELTRRRPGQGALTSGRKEEDIVRILSGISSDGLTLGTPIGFIIENKDARSEDYENLRHVFRPSHADYTYFARYGIRDHRGGGRASARETACRVVGGAFARQVLEARGIRVMAFTRRIGRVEMPDSVDVSPGLVELSAVRCPETVTSEEMVRLIESVRADGDSVGGIAECRISGVAAGVGDPVFGKLDAALAAAMMGIPAAKGVEFGMGFDGCCRLGSETVDEFGSGFRTLSNNSGGIQGGISNGADIVFRVAFKPVATLMRTLRAATDCSGVEELKARGRHDPCVLPRAVPVVEAMAAMTVLDAVMEI